MSYNCRGLPKNDVVLHTRPDILNLLNNYDIICFQETWLAKQELDLCNSLHDEFSAISVAKVDYADGILHGRPHGGVSILYKTRLASYVSPIYFQDCDWCVGMTFTYDSNEFTIFNVYLPYEKNENEEEFLDKLSLLESYIETVGHSAYAIVGDFNSNISIVNGRVNSKFGKYVVDFCDSNSLILTSQKLLPDNSHTYISERWGSTSWLDLIVSSTDFHNSVFNMEIKYELTNSDHIPFSFDIRTSALPPLVVYESNTNVSKKVCWKSMSRDQLELYTTFTDLLCNQTNFESILPVCKDPNCNLLEHRKMLDVAYDKFINCLKSSADKACTFTKKTSKPPGKPGWTEFVKEKHITAMEFYKIWCDNGKPRQGPIFEHYHRSKLRYKYAVRSIKRNADKIKADKVASNLENNDYSGFWQSVKKFNKRKAVLPQQIGKAIGESNICDQWKSHFYNIYNSVPDSCDETFHNIRVGNDSINEFMFTVAQLITAVSKLETNKSCGYDSIFAEHIKHCSVSMLRILTALFNSFLIHGHLPSAFMPVLISPIFKKGGSVSDIDSYRPIALANCISKLYEALLRDKIFNHLQTSFSQFGYKRKLGTDMCLYTFKEIIDCYNRRDSNIYCCFLDASRAYDRVSHKTLFNMLSERKVPLIFIRIIAYWYKHQLLFVKWGNALSSSFRVTNGVRQGSVISPYLFCVYFDKISKSLNGVKIGCKLKNLLINHLFYADDLCIFSPSSRGLQQLLDICFDVGAGLDIIFNETKCKIMIFKSKSYRKCIVPRFRMGQNVLKVCTTYKYLGHFISNSRSDKFDIARQCRSIYAKGNSLVRTFYRCSDLVKVNLFKSYCSSMYTCYLWSNYTQSELRKLAVSYHSVFKKLLNYPRNTSNSLLFVYYNVPTFQEVLRKSIFSFKCRLDTSNNVLINDVIHSDLTPSSNISVRWNTLLHQ